jgi:transcriptional regulator of arginine metabolism
MKEKRQDKILKLIEQQEIFTQEELADRLLEEGFPVTQATISRDIRELQMYKAAGKNGRSRYAVMQKKGEQLTSNRYMDAFRAGFVSVRQAQNILVIRTVSGMANGVAAALEAMEYPEVVGCIAGDDTIFCAIENTEEAKTLMEKIKSMG